MALALLSHVVADLTLGKPALPWLSSTACVRDALTALKHLGDDVAEISIWDCSDKASSAPELAALSSFAVGKPSPRGPASAHHHCLCIGKICMQKIICYLASDKCLCNLPDALDAPVSALLDCPPTIRVVQHIDPDASLLEALDLLIGGAQNLVVPITRKASLNSCHVKSGLTVKMRSANVAPANICLPRDHDGQEYCWLTQEDVLRFLLGSISVFSPLPMMSIEALGLIRTDVRMVQVDEDVSSVLESIEEACHDLSAVAIVDTNEGETGAFHLVGDISCATLQTCNVTAALAMAALSAGNFLVFCQDCRNPPQFLVDMIRSSFDDKLGVAKQSQPTMSKKEDANLLLQKLEPWEDSSSDDDDSGADSPIGPHDLSRKWHSAHFRSSRKSLTLKSRSGPIFCTPKSSLIAVLLQALAHREQYVWVTEEDDSLMGIVTFKDILTVMLRHINVFN